MVCHCYNQLGHYVCGFPQTFYVWTTKESWNCCLNSWPLQMQQGSQLLPLPPPFQPTASHTLTGRSQRNVSGFPIEIQAVLLQPVKAYNVIHLSSVFNGNGKTFVWSFIQIQRVTKQVIGAPSLCISSALYTSTCLKCCSVGMFLEVTNSSSM